MSSRDPVTFRFDAYRLNPAARELFLDDERVALAPKVIDALLWLFEHRERAVGRDELAATVWGRADVSDTQVDQLIWYLRRGLGDNGTAQEVIRTVPRFGYRWVAEVEAVTPAPTAADGKPDSASPMPLQNLTAQPSSSLRDMEAPTPGVVADESSPQPTPAGHLGRAGAERRSILVWLGMAMLAALVAGLWWFRAAGPEPNPEGVVASTPARTGPLIAVLPVQMDAIHNSEWAWLRLGLMDLLAERLREGGLAVVPAHNVMALMGSAGHTAPTAAMVREVTGATIVIGATIGHSGEGWRLQLELDGMAGAAREIEIHAAEPALSAREAADRLLVLLNRPPVSGHPYQERVDEEALIQHISAALHSNRVDMARALLDEASAPLRESPRVQLVDADVLYRERRTAEALGRYEALADAPPSPALNDYTRGEALRGAGVIEAERGGFDAAIRRFDTAAELARSSESAQQFGKVLSSRGAVYFAQRHYDAAEKDFVKARVALETIGDTLDLARLESNEGGLLVSQRRFSEADALLTRSLERLERFPPVATLWSAYNNKIYLDLAQLDIPAALAVAQRAQAALQRPDVLVAPDLQLPMQIIRAELAAGQFTKAEALLKEAAPALRADDHLSNAYLFAHQAQLALERRNPAEAALLAARAEDVWSLPALAAPHFASGRAASSLLHLRALHALGEYKQAQTVLQGFEHWVGERTDPDVLALLELARAETASHTHDVSSEPQLLARFEAALTAATRSAPATLALVAAPYGRYLLAHERLDDAAVVIGRMAHWAARDFQCALLQVELYHALGEPDAWRRALVVAQALAGERRIPATFAVPPQSPRQRAEGRGNLPVFSLQAPRPPLESTH